MLRLDPDQPAPGSSESGATPSSGVAVDHPSIAEDERDDVSDGDIDFVGRPLPRIPHTVVALRIVQALSVSLALCAAVVAQAVGGVLVGVIVGAIFLVPILLMVMAAIMIRRGFDPNTVLHIERAAHPAFFALMDEVTDAVGVPRQSTMLLANDSNSYNGLTGGESRIMVGFGAIAAYDLTALRSTLGHELGHHLAGDASDTGTLSLGELEFAASLPLALSPVAVVARRLLVWARSDALRRSRLYEHSADFWGGVAAGPGTTERCLLLDKRAAYLWQALTHDVAVLAEGGFRPRDIYGVLRRSVAEADCDGFEILPSSSKTPTDSTHPGERSRVAMAEAQLQHLSTRPDGGDAALALFDNLDSITADLTELYFSPDGESDSWLTIVDDDELWGRYLAALRPQLKMAFVTPLDPEPGHAASILWHRVRPMVEAGAKLFDGDQDVTVVWIGRLLDVLVGEGALSGSRIFGAQRLVGIDGVEFFRTVLAARLASGEMWDRLDAELASQPFFNWARHRDGVEPSPVVVVDDRELAWEEDTDDDLRFGHDHARAAE